MFSVETTDAGSGARAGILRTAHGVVPTPMFMPVGTAGTVKAVQPRELDRDIGARIVLGNTYHLYLRPGMEVLEAAGGLHRFMVWDGPILTDSGGYQVYSLAQRRKITDEGVVFQSHIDGSSHWFTPESVIDIQRSIGSDIMMVLDECPPGNIDRAYAEESNDRTTAWAERCKARFVSTSPLYEFEQHVFPIVQGASFADLRRISARRLVDMGFEGYAIGGLSVGEPPEVMYAMVEVCTEELPIDRPRYLMGVGTPANLIESVARGIDLFDCVMPTRNGRNGMIFTTEGAINIRNRKWQTDFSPIDTGLDGYVSQTFSKAYLRHLIQSKEILGLQIASLQNLSFYLRLMREAREAIVEDRFGSWRREWLPRVSRRL